MTEEVSKARQALRDYARTAHEVQVPMRTSTLRTAEPKTIEVSREEAAGKAFMAAQAALTVAEDLRAEGEEPVTTKVEIHGRLVPWPQDVAARRAQREAANRIELAVLKIFS